MKTNDAQAPIVRLTLALATGGCDSNWLFTTADARIKRRPLYPSIQ